MFRVVILHEPMTIRGDIMYEGQQHLLKDVDINFLNHNSLKYTMPEAPRLLITAQTYTFTGCLALQMCRGKQGLAYSTSISKALRLSPENKLLRQGNIHAKIAI